MKKNIKSFEILMLVMAIMCLPAASRAQAAGGGAGRGVRSDGGLEGEGGGRAGGAPGG